MRQLSHNEFENFPHVCSIKFCYCFYYDKHFVVKYFDSVRILNFFEKVNLSESRNQNKNEASI